MSHACEQVLKELYTQEMRVAWHWLWEWLTDSMFVVEEVCPSVKLFRTLLGQVANDMPVG